MPLPAFPIGSPSLSISLALSLVTLLDYLWPFWDRERQTLHDKIANTVVVNG